MRDTSLNQIFQGNREDFFMIRRDRSKFEANA